MGTNFYMITKNKTMASIYAPYSYELTDTPYFGYEIHVAKTSCGWLPLFQGHKNGINSVSEYKAAYETGEFDIVDEYGTSYNWNEFEDRVLKFNGGIRGAQDPEKIERDKSSMFYDKNLPEYRPISHIGGTKQSYKYDFDEFYNDYFKDSEGFEFDKRSFS